MKNPATIFLLLSATASLAGEPLDIRIEKANWQAVREDIRRVCQSSANVIWEHVPDQKLKTITVGQSNNGPIVLYKRGNNGAYRVRLDVRGTYWSQFGYQFAHEFCHILCRYREDPNPHKWFEESLCETASLFALRRMAETWKTKPPYPNWKSFHKSHAKYVQDRIDKAHRPGTLAAWYAEKKPLFNSPDYTRKIEHEAAVFLLPFFEEEPSGWAALQTLYRPSGSPADDFADLLKEWQERAPEEHKAFIGDLAKAFGL